MANWRLKTQQRMQKLLGIREPLDEGLETLNHVTRNIHIEVRKLC